MMRVRRGFTLIELLVTVAILAMLATAAMPLAELAVRRTKEQQLRQALREIRSAIDAYKQAFDDGLVVRTADASGYPPTLEILTEGVPNQRDLRKRPIYFLRRVPPDPFYEGVPLNAAQTWGLRSYASSPNDPQAGHDVFDVYSTSELSGINGIPYKEW